MKTTKCNLLAAKEIGKIGVGRKERERERERERKREKEIDGNFNSDKLSYFIF